MNVENQMDQNNQKDDNFDEDVIRFIFGVYLFVSLYLYGLAVFNLHIDLSRYY